ncbi:MAG: Gfo/Idh/MocA family oxidoreductase [Chloroflexi bacterium]|nr:Gfo/Idh/MocA family oxidoreductase [Chloroflexota bacterium]
MYKTVIIGVGGGRAHGHADAYQYVKRGRVVAVCDLMRDSMDDFADKYDVKARYTDYREMFEKEKPELAQVSTPPSVRLEVLEAAEAAGVPAVVVEKPLAIQGEDYLAIRDFAARNPKIKVAINHQLQFHPRRQHLQKLVADGAIGDIRFIEASSGMNLAYQGTHSLQAIGAFNPATPTTVFGQVSGAMGLQPNVKEHYAPDQSLAAVEYDNGVQATLRCGENAPRVPRGDAIYQHKRIAVYGMKGYIHWTMWGWETFINGAYDSGDHEYPEEDVLGQAAMTEAMFDWLEDDSAVHPLNLDRALVDFNVILALYASSLNHKVLELPYEPEADLVPKLRDALQD